MDEISLDERFTHLESIAAGTFQPAPISAVLAEAQRRRRSRRFTLAALCALLIAAPVGGFAMTGGQSHPAPRPTVTPSPTGFHPTERKVSLPGVDLPLESIWFTHDRSHAWAMYKSCHGPNDCQYALGHSDDAGVTWQRVPLPDLASDHEDALFYPLDDKTLSIYVLHKRFWLTVDGGKTYTQSPPDSPPDQALLASIYPVPAGDLTLLCPAAIGFEDGASGIECDREQLRRIGSGPVQPQPTLPGQLEEIISGADGRAWLTSIDGDRTRIAVSTDDAHTWHELPALAGAEDLRVSPDGREVWAVDSVANRLWLLTGSTWTVQPDLPEHTSVAAVGGGLLAVCDDAYKTVGFWRNGVYTQVDGLAGSYIEVIPDGTVLVYTAADAITVGAGGVGVYLGTGTGSDRTWIHISAG